ncbi:MAG: DMT family transporter [Candidatus Hodarchaeales archaeon]
MAQTPRKTISLNFIVTSLIIVVLWSTPPLVSKIWVSNEALFPGLFFGFLRYILGFLTLFLMLITRRSIGNFLELLFKRPKAIIFCASWLVLMIIGQNFSILFILGASSSILLNFNPVLVYLIAPILFADESYSTQKSIAVLLSTIGIFLVFLASSDLLGTDLNHFLLGNFLGFLSGVAWAGYSLSLKKLFPDESTMEVTSLNLGIAAVFLLVSSLITETLPPISSYTLESVTGLLIIGVGAAAIAFTLYLQLVQSYGAVQAANIQFLIPLFSLLFAWIFIGEFSFMALIGGIICAIGVAVITTPLERKRKDEDK